MKLNSRQVHRKWLSAMSLVALWVVAIGALSGCSAWNLAGKMPWSSSEDKLQKGKFEKPVRMVAIWTPTTLSQPGQPVTRGLGGRLYFYNDVGDTIPVEGQLMVYAYDDSNRQQNVSHLKSNGGVDEPDRKFAFTSEQFTDHYSATDLGASYSVWIPWGPVAGPPVKISVVPVFTSSSGNIVMAQASRNVMKGTTSGDEEHGSASIGEDDGVVRLDSRSKQTELRTTTIPISETTAERIMRATPQDFSPPPAADEKASYQSETRATEILETASASKTASVAGRGVPPPWLPATPPPARFAPPKFPVPAGPSPPPTHDRVPTPPTQ